MNRNGHQASQVTGVLSGDGGAVDEVPLDETLALAIQLGQSRVNEAQLMVQLRQRELQSTLDRVRARYEEGGRYAVEGVNFEKMVVTRSPAERTASPVLPVSAV